MILTFRLPKQKILSIASDTEKASLEVSGTFRVKTQLRKVLFRCTRNVKLTRHRQIKAHEIVESIKGWNEKLLRTIIFQQPPLVGMSFFKP